MRLFLFLLFFPTLVQAGAWQREQGAWFFATSIETGGGAGPSTGIYGEYGLAEDLTLKLDVFASDQDGLVHARGLAQRPLLATGRHVAAYVIGFGWGNAATTIEDPVFATVGPTTFQVGTVDVRVTDENYEVLAGLSWGMGLNDGWANVDQLTIWHAGLNELRTKVDATRGWTLDNGMRAIAQFQAEWSSEAMTLNFAPSVTYDLTKTFTVEVGLIHPLRGDDDTKLKIGLWTTF